MNRWITKLDGALRSPSDAVSYLQDVLMPTSAELHILHPLRTTVRALTEHVIRAAPQRDITVVVTQTPGNLSVTLLPHIPEQRLSMPPQVHGVFVRTRYSRNDAAWYWNYIRFAGRPVLWVGLSYGGSTIGAGRPTARRPTMRGATTGEVSLMPRLGGNTQSLPLTPAPLIPGGLYARAH